MKTLEKSNVDKIFRAYDIRGIAGSEIDKALCFAVGYALSKFFKKICVAHDHRMSSEEFAKSLINGFTINGNKAIFIGMTPTPIVQFASRKLNCEAGVMITASHNPKEYNGIKVFRNDGERMNWEEVKKIILEEKQKIISLFSQSKEKEYEKLNVIPYYKEFLQNTFKFRKKYKIVIDGSNGPMGNLAKEILEGFGFETICIACEIDPNFPAHEPDPSKEKNTELCKKKVKQEKADFGLCFDGDGDRIIMIDEKSRFIPGDYLLAILSFLYEKPKVVTEVKASKAVIEFIQSRGGEVILERVGNVFVRKTMLKQSCDFAGEYSGHYFFKEYPVDDSLFAALKVISVIEKTNKPLGEIFDIIPKYYSSPEIRIKVGEKEKWKIVEEAKKYFSKLGNVIDIDGIRVETQNAWGLLRASNTEPKISIRIEGKTKSAYEDMLKKFLEFLKKQGIEVK
ncbi:MAG TPA: phosphomannomutase/phosphoglucomutase [Nanoarchaeota archaeon]|nr:phosphomannomutase/phosphoglucomutase [Nanoarchaeota archaeon]